MKKTILLLTLLLTTNSRALVGSIYDSPEIMEVIESAQYHIEAAGELSIIENSWVETQGIMNCVGDTTSEQVLEEFEAIFDAADSGWRTKSKAWEDLKSILGNHDDYVHCKASTYVQYYDISWDIFYRDGYKIAIEWASEN